jgi:hypothetical protein
VVTRTSFYCTWDFDLPCRNSAKGRDELKTGNISPKPHKFNKLRNSIQQLNLRELAPPRAKMAPPPVTDVTFSWLACGHQNDTM